MMQHIMTTFDLDSEEEARKLSIRLTHALTKALVWDKMVTVKGGENSFQLHINKL